MKVTVERLPQRQVALNIEADPGEVERSRQQAYRHLVQRARIPGFRQGKAPLAMVERFAGKALFMEEAFSHLLPEVTFKALEEQGIKAVGEPSIQVLTTEPVTWKATVDLAPEVDLGAYRDIRIAPDLVIVTPDEVERALEELRFEQAPWEPADRESRMGDLLTVDVHAEESGKAVADDKGVEYRLVEGTTRPVPGFAQQLVGLKSGENKEFTLAFPQESENKELAGKEFRFAVSVGEIKGKTPPPLDDELAKGVGGGFDSLEALRQHVTGQVRLQKEREGKDALERKALDAVIAGARLEYSASLVAAEAGRILEEQEDRLRRNRVSTQEYLASVGKSREQLLEELKPVAEQRLVGTLVASKLREEEKIEATDEEVQAELEQLESMTGALEDQGKLRRAFESEVGQQSLRRSVLTRKTMQRLVEIVTQPSDAQAVEQ